MRPINKISLNQMLGYVAALISVVIGILVIVGWYLREPLLIQINRAFVPMQYNTALGFLLSGIALLLSFFYKKKIIAILSILIILIGALTLSEYIFGWDLYIDQLFMEHFINVKTSHPGRMAPNTAFCFLLTGLSLLLFYFVKVKKKLSIITGILGVLILILGTFAFIGYFIDLKATYSWGNFTQMAIHTAFGFMVLGVGVLTGIWYQETGKNWIGVSLSRKLYIYILIPIIILYLTVATYSTYLVKEATYKEVRLKLKDIGWQNVNQVDMHLTKLTEIARSTRRFISTQQNLTVDELNNALINNLRLDDLILRSSVVFEPYAFSIGQNLFAPYAIRINDSIHINNLSIEEISYTHNILGWYKFLKENNKSIWSEPFLDKKLSNKWVSTYSIPINKNQKFWAATTIDIELDNINTVLNTKELENFSYGILTNKGNNVLLASNTGTEQNISKYFDSQGIIQNESSKIIEFFKTGKFGFTAVDNVEGETFLKFYAPIKSSNWIFYIGLKESIILEPVKSTILRLSIIFFVVLLFFALILYIISNRIIQPIFKLNRAAEKFSQGVLSTKLNITSRDEIGVLAQTFSTMSKKLSHREKELKNTQGTLENLNNQLEKKVTERTVQLEEEKKFSDSILDAIPAMFYALDDKGRFVRWNNNYLKISGLTAEEMPNTSPFKIIADDYVEKTQNALQEVYVKGYAEVEAIVIDKDNVAIPYFLNGHRLILNDKAYVIGIGLDLSELKKAQNQIVQSELRFKTLVNNMPGVVYRCAPREPWIMYFINDEIEDISGYPKEVFLGEQPQKTFMSIIHPDDREGISQNIQLAIKEHKSYVNQYRIIHKNGGIRHVYAQGQAIYKKNNTPDFLVGSIFDDTSRKKAAKELQEIYELSDNALDLTKSGFWHIRFNDKVYYYSSKQTSKIFGEEPNKKYKYHLTYEWYTRIIAADVQIAEKTKQHFSDVVSGKIDRYDTIYPYIRPKDKKKVWIRAIGYIDRNDKGEAISMNGVAQDITEQVNAEEEIKKLSVTVEQSPAPTIITDLKGNIEYANPKFNESTGYKNHEIIGNNTKILNSGFHNKRYFKVMWNTILAGNIWVGEICNRKKNGEIYWESASISSLKNDKGKITHFVSIKEDITERKKMEEKLSDERNRLQKLMDSSPVAIVISSDTIIQYANERFTNIFGTGIGDVTSGKYVDEKKQDYIYDKLNQNQAVTDYNLKTYNKNDEVIEILANFYPIEYQGKKSILVWIIEITQLKEIENELKKAKDVAEEATKTKSVFLASMSHEIRTPMNAVIGLSHLAMQTNLNPKQYDYINKIQSSGKVLLGIINDILDFSKIEAGKLSIEKTEFDLEKIFENIATIVTYKAHEKNIELVFHIDEKVPFSLNGDPLRLGQILINLTNNAIKFTDEGEILITCNVEKEIEKELWLKFSIKDTGIGISKEQKRKLFQDFSQADGGTTRKYGGTGLGLAICKKLTELMGGKIWVESEYGKGSTFNFIIKLERQKKQKRRNLLPSIDLHGIKVLLCDDNETSLKVLSSILTSLSFKVKAVNSGKKALRELDKDTKEPYQMIIVDWKMPELNGVEVIKKIKKSPTLTQIPLIIMVTAYTRETIIKEVDKLGIAGLLTKPVSYSMMFDNIMNAFGKNITKKEKGKLDITEYDEKLKDIQGARVLVVEDNQINQQIASELLESVGLVVDIVGNGKEAVDKVHKKSNYDLVFLDLQMPVMDGLTTAEKIRSNKDLDHIPIVAMTADVIGEVVIKTEQVGMNGFIPKPIDPNEVIETIIKWIKPGKRADAQLVKNKAKKTATLVTIPQIENINITEGLSRINNNQELYKKLLFKFYDNNVNLVAQIKAAYKLGNEEMALRLVHSVKGVSGNIGANKLFLITKQLEQILKEKNYKNLNQLLDEYYISLRITLNAIDRYRKSLKLKENKPNQQKKQSNFDQRKFTLLLDELKILLSNNNMDAKRKIEEIFKLGELGSYQKKLKKLYGALDIYDFEEAIHIANRLEDTE